MINGAGASPAAGPDRRIPPKGNVGAGVIAGGFVGATRGGLRPDRVTQAVGLCYNWLAIGLQNE